MRAIENTPDRALLEFTRDELVLIYGALVESTEALSTAEFHARVGIREAQAEALTYELKLVIGSAAQA